MLDAHAKQQIREFVVNDCGFLEPIRTEVVFLNKAVFREIGAISSSEPSDKEKMLVSLSAINLDLSDSLRGCVMNGHLIAGLGLLRWQIVLCQRCYTFYHSPEHLTAWLKDKSVEEKVLRKFMKRHRPSIDDDWEDFKNLSQMFHLNYSMIHTLYELATGKEIYDGLKHSIKRYLYADIRNTARILMVCLTHLKSITTGSYEKYNSITTNFNTVDTRLHELREKFAEAEKSLGI